MLGKPSWEPFALDGCGRGVDADGLDGLAFEAVWTPGTRSRWICPSETAIDAVCRPGSNVGFPLSAVSQLWEDQADRQSAKRSANSSELDP